MLSMVHGILSMYVFLCVLRQGGGGLCWFAELVCQENVILEKSEEIWILHLAMSSSAKQSSSLTVNYIALHSIMPYWIWNVVVINLKAMVI